jgi:hypothetical protein
VDGGECLEFLKGPNSALFGRKGKKKLRRGCCAIGRFCFLHRENFCKHSAFLAVFDGYPPSLPPLPHSLYL